MATIFQSVSTRTAGFSVLNLEKLSATSAFIQCVCMWISVCPVVVVMRSTTRTSGNLVEPRSNRSSAARQQKEQDLSKTQQQFMNFMSENAFILLFLFFL